MFMRHLFKCTLLLLSILIPGHYAMAQDTLHMEELGQMSRHAAESMSFGNYTDAITTYKLAIKLAPDNKQLYKDLGNAFYRAGRYAEAEETLKPLTGLKGTGPDTYAQLAAAQIAQKKLREAKATAQDALKTFIYSGEIHQRLAQVYTLEGKPEEALNTLLDGLDGDPTCAPCYYDAATIYLDNASPAWGLIYGEMYLGLRRDTTGDQLMKTKLFAGYKALFENIAGDKVPVYGKTDAVAAPTDFITTVQKVYTKLAPVVSDGITTENLTMLRTRFLMDWFSNWNAKYPFSLFTYQDERIRNGYFDVYNEWLFGLADNTTEYNAWNTFHPGDIDRFLDWNRTHRLIPSMLQKYNTRDMSFLKK